MDLATVKQRLYLMRNGIVADSLRKAALPYKMIFGVNLQQIKAIANDIEPSKELAEELWADSRTRECLLIAPLIYPLEALTRARAAEMLREAPTPEVADVLCHRLLRRHPDAFAIAVELIADPDDMHRYAALRLMMNLLDGHETAVKPFAEAERAANRPFTRLIAAQILDEIAFREEEEEV